LGCKPFVMLMIIKTFYGKCMSFLNKF